MLLKQKTEEELRDEEDWDLEQLEFEKRGQLEKLPYLDSQIDDLLCELGDLKGERDEIVSIAKEYQKEINAILNNRVEREFKVYSKVLWYKCLITENQTTLDIFGLV